MAKHIKNEDFKDVWESLGIFLYLWLIFSLQGRIEYSLVNLVKE